MEAKDTVMSDKQIQRFIVGYINFLDPMQSPHDIRQNLLILERQIAQAQAEISFREGQKQQQVEDTTYYAEMMQKAIDRVREEAFKAGDAKMNIIKDWALSLTVLGFLLGLIVGFTIAEIIMKLLD